MVDKLQELGIVPNMDLEMQPYEMAYRWHQINQSIMIDNINQRFKQPNGICWCGKKIKRIKSESFSDYFNAILSVDEYVQYMKARSK